MEANNSMGTLREARLALLHLHKTLLEDEREAYERIHDRIQNSYEVLRLVMNDPWFAWLHSLSELIVKIDETLDAEQPASEGDVAGVIQQARELISPDENGAQFQQKYFRSLQRSPDAVLAHSEAMRVIGTNKQK